MAISGHVTTFAGRYVEEFDPVSGISDPINTAYRLRVEYDEEQTFSSKLDSLLQDPQAADLEGLVIGTWDSEVSGGVCSSGVVEDLVSAKDRLPNLKALLIGDIMFEESEISWIEQGDMTPVLDAYPDLEAFQVRGGNNLRFSSLQHETLKELIVETGGLSPKTIADICTAHLPNLEHLELWLGSKYYGGDATVEDVAPIISGELFPNLTKLALADSEIADDIAKALVHAPIMKQIKRLDMSKGTMGDEGADALVDALLGSSVKRLDVSDNYLSKEAVQRLSWLPIKLRARNQDDDYGDPEDRYVSVAE